LIFLFYGVLGLGSMSMVEDFERFELGKLRVFTGVLEVMGGSGLLVGLRWSPALRISSGGLALLMLLAFGVRLRVRDGVMQSLPSLVLMMVNVSLLIRALRA